MVVTVMARVILHSDANSFYASVESVYDPNLRGKALAVSGDAENRHGIILTKNQIAKRFGVKTGEAIWQAREKCPGLVCVSPHYSLYLRFSAEMRRMYEEYTDHVESFGLDEAWLDLSAPGRDLRDGERIAHEIRNRVREELGITVSLGVADNKVFAKLGSDMKKPDAVTVIERERYAETVWRLPAYELLYIGSSTRRKLAAIGVLTIGDLARCDTQTLEKKIGRNGVLLKAFANGGDVSPVQRADLSVPVKSVGNSTTPPRDICDIEDAKCILYMLAQSVAARMREQGFRGACVSIGARTTDLQSTTRQCHLPRPTNLTGEIIAAALRLFEENYLDGFPYRSLGVCCSALSGEGEPVQLDLNGVEQKRLRLRELERAVDTLRGRFGQQVVRRCIELTDDRYASVNVREDNIIHPMPFFAG